MKNEYVTQYNTFFNELCATKKRLSKELSDIDLQQQDILHFLEFEKCDAVTMVKATKKLKEVRKKRREIKNKYQVVYVMCERLKNPIKNENFADGDYKTDVIKEFM
jgi:hypothetical protein